MKQSQFTTTILEAEEGKYITQVADVDVSQRVLVTKIALSYYDSPDNWKEITEEEAEELKEHSETSIEEAEFVEVEGPSV